MQKLYLIDASGYLYRSYFAIRNMTNSKGESTNALFGFIRSVMKLMKDFPTDHIAAIFDGPRNALKRVAIYPEYKAHRSEMPSDLGYQIRWAHQFCEFAGIPQLNIPEAEADDVMGSVSTWAASLGTQVFLCTSDKDMCQLVNDKILILNTFKENQIIDAMEVEKIYGIPPSKMIDWLAIVGDASDNIPGLPGFGPKTASELLKNFESLEYILEHPEEIPGKKKQETIAQEKDKALISKELVRLDNFVEIPKDFAFYELKETHRAKLKEFYTGMNFHSLIREMESILQMTKQPEAAGEEVYQLVDDEESFKALLASVQAKEEVAISFEITSAHPLEAELVGISFSVEAKKSSYIPLNGHLGSVGVIEGLKSLFENSKTSFFSHNVKCFSHVLSRYNIKIKNVSFDTMLASFILNSHSRQHGLDTLILEYFGKVRTPLSDLTGKGKKTISIKELPISEMSLHSNEKADFIWRLKEVLEKHLQSRKLEKLLKNLELPLMTVLGQMEKHGIYINHSKLKQLSASVGSEIEILQQDIYKMAGIEFNLNSPAQLQKILFEKLQIPYPKKRSSSLSTGEEILEALKNEYPIAGKLLEYRKLEKLRSTYLDALPETINPHDARIHTTFNQSVAATGRLSSQDPNLQNIPVRTEAGRKIREAFEPQKRGWSYVAADYSQIELRLLAHLSEDPYLLDAFNKKADIHVHTAASIYGIGLEEITKEQRNAAKTVNFGIIYGQQAFGLAQELNISPRQAQVFIETYFNKFTKVRSFLEECKEKARQTGKAVTYTGRERLIPEINSKNGMLRAQAERLAVNTPIQGTAADLIKMAMLKINSLLEKHKKLGYMILQIHDELIFEVPDFELLDFEHLVREAMENVIVLKVPLVVDIMVGKNWKEC